MNKNHIPKFIKSLGSASTCFRAGELIGNELPRNRMWLQDELRVALSKAKVEGYPDPYCAGYAQAVSDILASYYTGIDELARRLFQFEDPDAPPKKVYNEYDPWLKTPEEIKAAQNDPNKPERACCNDEHRGWNGGCGNCGDPCL